MLNTVTALAVNLMKTDMGITRGRKQFYGHRHEAKGYAAFPHRRGHTPSGNATICGKSMIIAAIGARGNFFLWAHSAKKENAWVWNGTAHCRLADSPDRRCSAMLGRTIMWLGPPTV